MAVSVCRKAEVCVRPIKRMIKSGKVELKTCLTNQPARETLSMNVSSALQTRVN